MASVVAQSLASHRTAKKTNLAFHPVLSEGSGMACPTHGPLLDAIEWSGGTAALAALGYAFGLCRNWLEAGETGSGGGATLPIGDLLAKNKLGGWTLASSTGLGQQLASSGFGLLNMLASSGFGVLGMVARDHTLVILQAQLEYLWEVLAPA